MKQKIFVGVISFIIGIVLLYMFVIKGFLLNNELLENNNKYYIKGRIESVYRYNNTVYFVKSKIDSIYFIERQNLYHIDLIKGLVSPDSNYVYVRTQITKYPRNKTVDLSEFPNTIILNNNEEKNTYFYKDSVLYEVRKLRDSYTSSCDEAFESKIVENNYLEWIPF